MNVDTGQVFRNLTKEQLEALQKRDPKIVEVSEDVADAVELGMEVKRVYRAQHARRLEAEKRREEEGA